MLTDLRMALMAPFSSRETWAWEMPRVLAHLHLGFSIVKPQGQNLLFPGLEGPEGVAQGDVLHPTGLGVPGVPDLVHHRQRIAPIGIHRVIQAHRGAYRIQGLTDFFRGMSSSREISSRVGSRPSRVVMASLHCSTR